ncbi:TetR/AcrR family transcriptional regulator [Vagococcus silagei]|uniref:TetR/AcrR family transcriptional regulator n=1 Tax=Vagococcus silagei TaxID=2508885 RepID=A0A4S3B7V2_9ENTE|nr:TetR/AcrR family transcriptional regulator [Vagococcus silagei]THB62043.1 TetR/AcrR family transcriptional regulator [Vagococcus silagei]
MGRTVMKPGERKNQILDVAESLFRTEGYNKTTTSKIAKEAGVANGTLFYHFESKEKLADALVARKLHEDLDVFAVISNNPSLSGFQKLAWFFVFELDDQTNHLNRYHYMTSIENLVLQQKMFQQMVTMYTPIMTEWLVQAQNEGTIKIDNPSLTAEFFLTTFHHWVDGSLNQWTKQERISRIESIQPYFEKLFGVSTGTLALANLRQSLPANL